MSARRPASRALGALVLALACATSAGCAAATPPALADDPRWLEALDDGEVLPITSTLHVELPTLERPAELVLSDAAPVELEGHRRGSYWPEALPAAFEDSLREALGKATGFDAQIGGARAEPADYVLRLRVRRYQAQLVRVGPASSIAPLGFLLPHLATFYNAPDELYRVTYELSATLRRARDGAEEHAELRASKTLALTDFQRGWTLFSRWSQQRVNLVEGDDVEAWQAYGPNVIEAVEPFARRTLLIELMRFVRSCARAER